MIEVEKKFRLTEEEKKRLIQGAQFLGEKIFTDVYYDTPDYALTTKDKWLRSRNGVFELKLPLHESINRAADQYDELEIEEEIRKAIKLPVQKSFLEDLEVQRYKMICTCKTTRKKYKKQGFTIDIDEVGYDQDFSYNLVEIELMVEEKSAIEDAVQKILAFAGEQRINVNPAGGKIHEYLKRAKPEHFALLVKLGVLRDM